MAIKLQKGQKLSLSKEMPSLKVVRAGLGWTYDEASFSEDADLDASVFMLDSTGKVPSDDEFIYYYQRNHPSGAITHNGDVKKGGDQAGVDLETIDVVLDKIPANIERLVFTVTIYDPEGKLNFGQVSNAFIRLYNQDTKEVICSFDLGEDFCLETAVIAAELYRHNGEWKYNPIGRGISGDLSTLCETYEVDVKENN